LGVIVNENSDNVEVQLIVGLPLPFGQEGGMMVPSGMIRYFLGKDEALKTASEILAAAEALPDKKKVDIDVVTNPEKVANINKSARKAD